MTFGLDQGSPRQLYALLGMAHLFSGEGAHLTVAGRRTELLERVAASVRDNGGRAIAVTTDVTDEAAVRAMVAATVAEYGRVDVMCNNAAQPGTDKYIWEQTLENWNGTLAVDDAATKIVTIFNGADGKVIATIPTAEYNPVDGGHALDAILLEPTSGFEPETYGLRNRCSTN